MTLDLPTLYAIAAIALIVGGVSQLIPWLTERVDLSAMWWATGHASMGFANIMVLTLGHSRITQIGHLPNVIHIISYGLIFHSIRLFARAETLIRPTLVVIFICVVPVLCASATDQSFRNGYMNFVRGGWDLAIALTAIQIGRNSHLNTAWIMAFLFGAGVPLFWARAWMAWTGQLGPELFGPQHGPAIWLAAGAISLVIFRCFSLSQMAAEAARKALAEQAVRDPLTGSYNRSKLGDLAKSLRGPAVMMMIDLDRFKMLNDTIGHAAGDSALRLTASVAEEVIGANGTVIRMGGDEFLCVLPGVSIDDAYIIGRQISEGFAHGIASIAPVALYPSLSIGVAQGDLRDGLAKLLADADREMYRVKGLLRNRREGDLSQSVKTTAFRKCA